MVSDQLTVTENQPIDNGDVRVIAVRESLVTVETKNTPIRKNEVGFVCVGEERLMAEVLRIQGRTADMQVFEDTRGVRVGDQVDMTGRLLSVGLGPGLLGQVFDGLQNPLATLAQKYGFFLPRGVDLPPLDQARKWAFTPTVTVGDRVSAGATIGTVPEGNFSHKIMIPFDTKGEVEVTWIQQGSFTVDTPIARIRDKDGEEKTLTMIRWWPVRRPIPESMFKRKLIKRRYPIAPLTTTTRIIDTFFPIAQGGTGCIPGPCTYRRAAWGCLDPPGKPGRERPLPAGKLATRGVVGPQAQPELCWAPRRELATRGNTAAHRLKRTPAGLSGG